MISTRRERLHRMEMRPSCGAWLILADRRRKLSVGYLPGGNPLAAVIAGTCGSAQGPLSLCAVSGCIGRYLPSSKPATSANMAAVAYDDPRRDSTGAINVQPFQPQ
jgi:hypothetical protein